jgi:hypothetical protein
MAAVECAREGWRVGNFLIEATYDTGLFFEYQAAVTEHKKRVVHRYLELTDEANEVASGIMEIVTKQLTVHLPSLTPPEPWTSARQLISNAHVALVSSRFWGNDKRVQAAIDAGTAFPLDTRASSTIRAWSRVIASRGKSPMAWITTFTTLVLLATNVCCAPFSWSAR